jgi:hypothetical protein
MKMKVNNLLTLIILILIAGCAYLAGSCSRSVVKDNLTTQTDTVYIDKPYTDTVIIHHYAKPKTVTIYKEPNKARREAMEQRTIIQGLRIQPKGVEVATIDTAGFTRVAFYHTPISSTVLVADTGAVEIQPISIKKARWIRAGKVVILVATFITGALVF